VTSFQIGRSLASIFHIEKKVIAPVVAKGETEAELENMRYTNEDLFDFLNASYKNIIAPMPQIYNSLIKLAEKGDYSSALELLKYEKSIPALINKAYFLFQAGDVSTAYAILEHIESQKSQTSLSQFFILKTLITLYLEKFSEAKENLKRAVKLLKKEKNPPDEFLNSLKKFLSD